MSAELIERSANYDEVYVYTMGRPGFILQHVVDAWIVQSADEATKPIAVFFGLAGLHLRVEKRCSGTEVQRIHQRLAQQRKDWPALPLPADRGHMTVDDVLTAPPGAARDAAIDDWCRSVWGCAPGSSPFWQSVAFGKSRRRRGAPARQCAYAATGTAGSVTFDAT